MSPRRILVCLVIILNICLVSHVLPQNGAEDIQTEIAALEDSLREEPENTGILLRLGILYHNLGVEGDKKAVKRAKNLFEKLLELEPQNIEALAWYGSVLTLKGRDILFPISKLGYVNNGIEKMDKAVELAPDNVNVRMIRAHNSLNLPGMFHRIKVAINDFEHLLSLSQKSPQEFSKGLLVEIYLGLGNAYKKKGDTIKARENWQKIVEVLPNSKEAEMARILLEETK
ncbi:tetratricopeptide repeat protein [bacterium]|nr:tetratricopeptide repeat protein [bacterium]